MATWLMKQEPSEWGWDDLVAERKSYWDSVRNHQAAGNIRKMKRPFHHSVDEKRIVGIMKITGDACPDPTADEASGWWWT